MAISLNNYIVFAVFATLLSFVSGQNPGDIFRPPKLGKLYQKGEPTVIFTPGTGEYNGAWYNVEDRSRFIFKVRSCSDALIVLTTFPRQTTDNAIEIAIGIEGNTKSAIRYPFDAGSLAETVTPDILHCNEHRTFWIRWGLDIIELGRGPTFEEQRVVSYWDTSFHRINGLGLASAYSQSAVWTIREDSGDTLSLTTPNDYKYEYMWKSVSDRVFFSFGIKARSDCHIVLTQEQGKVESDLYEIVIGGFQNQRSLIRTNTFGLGSSNIKVDNLTSGLLNEDEFREFWISWLNGTIRAGQGTIYGKNVIMTWRDPSPISVRYLGVTTGFNSNGKWVFEDDRSSMTLIYTPAAQDNTDAKYNKTWIESPRKNFFAFSLRACKDAYIFISNWKTIDDEFGRELFIGRDNRETGLKNVIAAGELIKVSTPDILDCNQPRQFWMSWYLNTFKFGKGVVYNRNIYFQYNYTIPINALSLATYKTVGEWRIREQYGEKVTVHTQGDGDNNMWRTVRNQDYVTFAVRACSDAWVALSPTLGIDYQNEWFLDVMFGGYTNTRSIIRLRKGDQRDAICDFVDTQNILNCSEFRDLWVSWQDGKIRAGRGTIPGRYQIMEGRHAYASKISAISTTNYGEYSGEWQFEADNGDYTTFYTHENYSYAQHILDVRPWMNWITFDLRACGDGHIMLSSVWAEPDITTDLVEVIIQGWEGNKSGIRTERLGEVKVESTERNLLSCGNNRPFWLSWRGGLIELGKGYIYGIDKILEWKHPEPFLILGVHMSTGWNKTGRWQIKNNFAYAAQTYTNTEYGYQKIWRNVAHTQSLVFDVMACSDVHILMSERVSFLGNYGYEVVISGWQNTQSVIRGGDPQRDYVKASTVGLLNCTEFRSFWLTWYKGQITVGRGRRLGLNVFLAFQELIPKDMLTIAFTTGYGYNGIFNLPLVESRSIPPSTDAPVTAPPGGLDGGQIAGIVIGVLILVALVGVGLGAVVYVKKDEIPTMMARLPFRRQQPDQAEIYNPENNNDDIR